jgi:hypothetical protein
MRIYEMSDDRKERKDTAGAKQQPEGESSNTVPWVPDDEYRMNPARDVLSRWRPSRAVLDTNEVVPPLRNVIVPPQRPPENPPPALSSGVGPVEISLGHTVSVVTDWPALRAEMIPRLDSIEARLRELAPVIERFEVAYREHARIGHNNPPEDIDILPIGLAELELGIVAANLARTEINLEHPRSDVMRFCGLVLRWTGGLLAAWVKWIGAKGDAYVDGVLKALGPLTAIALVAKLAHIETDIIDVVGKIRHVLEVVQHLPF